MSVKTKVLGAAATLALVGGVCTVGTISAQAGTTQCGQGCVDVFSPRFGSNFIESVRHGVAKVGQPTILDRASKTDPAGDFMPLKPGMVSNFFAAGMVTADVNSHYGNLRALQIQYAPFGNPSGLCSAVAKTAFDNEALSLQPCSIPGTTVWILDPLVAPVAQPPDQQQFAIINGSTTDFSHPFSMTYRHDPPARIRLNNLQLSTDGLAPITQLWGSAFGPPMN